MAVVVLGAYVKIEKKIILRKTLGRTDRMFRNRNTKIVNKVVRKILMAQKWKNLITITAIVISAMLFTSLMTLIGGTVKSHRLMMQLQAGSKADAQIKGITKKQCKLLTSQPYLKDVGLLCSVSYLKNTKNHNIELCYLDEKSQDMFFSKPTYGRAPKQVNEFAASDRALKELGVKPKLGEQVKIIVESETDGQEYSYEMCLSGWWKAANEQGSLMLVSEEFINENKKELRGIVRDDSEGQSYSAAIIFTDRQNREEKLREAVRAIGGEPDDDKAENFMPIIFYKNTYMEWKEIGIPVLLIMVLFVLCSYLLIYNIFDIATVKNIRSYGLLSTIGATPSQIKRIVMKQAFFLASIGIPVGLLLGFGIGTRLLPVVLSGMPKEEYTNAPVVNTANPRVFLFSGIMTFLTIWISIYKPARTACKFNASDAVKYSEGNKRIKRKGSSNKVIHIAFANFIRNKKRSVLIVMSLAICIILFNSVFVISDSMDTKKYIQVHMKTDYIAANTNAFQLNLGYVYRRDGMSEDFCRFLNSLKEIKNLGYLYKNTKDDSNVSFDYGVPIKRIESYPNDKGIPEECGIIEIKGKEYGALVWEDGRLCCNVYGADETTVKRFHFDDILDGISEEEVGSKLSTGEYVIEGAVINPEHPGEVLEEPGYQCEIGQKITAYKDGKIYKTYTVLAHMPVNQAEVEANDGGNGAARVGQDGAKLYFPLEEFKQLYDTPTVLNCTFDAKNPKEWEAVEEKLEKYTEENPTMHFYSSNQLRRTIAREQVKLRVVGGIMAGILGVVGIINFVNLISTSVISRKKEFAVMESVGMTSRQLKDMIVFEGILYALSTGILGIAVCYLLGITVIKTILSATWYYTFRMSLTPGLLIWCAMLIIVVSSAVLSMKIYNKGELSDRLSYEE